jgi:hypothetical protein
MTKGSFSCTEEKKHKIQLNNNNNESDTESIFYYDLAIQRKACEMSSVGRSGSGSARIHFHFGRLDPDLDPHWEYGSKTSPIAWTHFSGGLGIGKLQFLIKKY